MCISSFWLELPSYLRSVKHMWRKAFRATPGHLRYLSWLASHVFWNTHLDSSLFSCVEQLRTSVLNSPNVLLHQLSDNRWHLNTFVEVTWQNLKQRKNKPWYIDIGLIMGFLAYVFDSFPLAEWVTLNMEWYFDTIVLRFFLIFCLKACWGPVWLGNELYHPRRRGHHLHGRLAGQVWRHLPGWGVEHVYSNLEEKYTQSTSMHRSGPRRTSAQEDW